MHRHWLCQNSNHIFVYRKMMKFLLLPGTWRLSNWSGIFWNNLTLGCNDLLSGSWAPLFLWGATAPPCGQLWVFLNFLPRVVLVWIMEKEKSAAGGDLQFSRSVVSDSSWLHGLQHTRLPCPSPTQTHGHWVGDAILCCPLLLLPSIFPSIRVFPNESVLCISSLHKMAKLLEFQLQYQSFQWTPRTDLL